MEEHKACENKAKEELKKANNSFQEEKSHARLLKFKNADTEAQLKSGKKRAEILAKLPAYSNPNTRISVQVGIAIYNS